MTQSPKINSEMGGEARERKVILTADGGEVEKWKARTENREGKTVVGCVQNKSVKRSRGQAERSSNWQLW